MSFSSKLVIISVIQDFTGFASTINTFLNALFTLIESLRDTEFSIAFCFSINVPKSVQRLRALNFKIVAVSRASNRFVSFKYLLKADAEHFLRLSIFY